MWVCLVRVSRQALALPWLPSDAALLVACSSVGTHIHGFRMSSHSPVYAIRSRHHTFCIPCLSS